MHKFYKWFLVSVVVVLVSACGGGGGSDVSGDTSLPNIKTIAIDKIKAYANDNTQAIPTIQDYKDAGVEGVTLDNIDEANKIVANLTESDVDTPEKIQILLRDNGLTIKDTSPPVITLNGANPKTIIEGEAYTDAGATAVDDRDGNVSVAISGNVNTNLVGTYIITYESEDTAGNKASTTRTVNVVDASMPDEISPVITLNGENPMSMIEGEIYIEVGATAVDDRDGNVSVEISGSVVEGTIGTYIVTYSAEDIAGNQASETRTVNVVAPPPSNIAPTSNAGDDKTVEVDNTVTITGSGTDSDGSITAYEWKKESAVLATTASFDYTPTTAGTDTLTLKVTDDEGSTDTDSMKVTVTSVTPPSNSTPTANAGADKTVEVDNTVTITGSGTDSDGSITAYEWKKESAVLATTASFDYTPTTAGTDTLTLKVTDDEGSTDTDSMKVTVTSVTPPSGLNWTFKGTVAQGTQFDAQTGPNNRIHLISSRYYQLDLSGNALVDESQVDEQQGLMDFPPAIAVGDDGSVHIVTRGAGDIKTGVDIRYQRRNTSGIWDRNYLFGGKVARNYVVGIAWADASNIIMSSTKKNSADVYGNIHLWQAGSSSASALGSLSGMWRADVDSRIRGHNSTVYLGAGTHRSSSATAYFSQASTGSGLQNRLDSNKKSHESGSPRRSFPDLAVDGQNNAHFVYGARNEVYYNKYNSSGNKVFGSDKRIFSSLGDWHLSIGLSALAVSENGQTIVAVALKAKGDQRAENSDILWTYSTDGGSSWSSVQDTGKNSDAGEGRRRPRLVAVGNSFVLLYGDSSTSGISMGVITF